MRRVVGSRDEVEYACVVEGPRERRCRYGRAEINAVAVQLERGEIEGGAAITP